MEFDEKPALPTVIQAEPLKRMVVALLAALLLPSV